ncbi:hypothetical protein NDU88_005387 [Pleurodeles waltl]|uniref:Uncharacterized protein n=1 Tax=Pleurodeles waltl TaxID=8319 RepID=A0AAV7NQ54_PLEWA|nr:hypothetical protein NDU88_005387 [Pleurodeles waltl]
MVLRFFSGSGHLCHSAGPQSPSSLTCRSSDRRAYSATAPYTASAFPGADGPAADASRLSSTANWVAVPAPVGPPTCFSMLGGALLQSLLRFMGPTAPWLPKQRPLSWDQACPLRVRHTTQGVATPGSSSDPAGPPLDICYAGRQGSPNPALVGP